MNDSISDVRLAGDVGYIYRIKATFGTQMTIENPSELSEGIKAAKRQVVEAVFGEFRDHFRLIENALYNHNVGEARKLLTQMEDKMFGVD